MYRLYISFNKKKEILDKLCWAHLKINIFIFLFTFRLFLETINEHPDYKNVPIEDRNINYRALRDVLPKTEKIKTKLLEQYTTEFMLYQEQKVNILFNFCTNYFKSHENRFPNIF